MVLHTARRLAFLGLLVIIFFSLASAIAAGNSVPRTRLTNQNRPITANDLKPPECAALNLTAILVGTGNFNGTSASELILGGPNADNIDGKGGNDCILGGGGDDFIDGGPSTDVCIGGPGNDTLIQCETQIQ